MKKLFLKVSAIAGMMVCSVSMSSCTHDEIDGSVREPVSKDQVAMSLFGNSGEDGSRTQLGENNNVFFCKGDSISVFNNADTNENAPFVANKDEDFPGTPDTARAATFNGEANIGAQYFAILYPYQKDATATGVGDGTATITATIPATQTAKAGNFDPHASVSVGLTQAHEWDVPKFYLKNVGGLLKFTAGGTGYNKIEITGAKNEEIAGKVSISVSGAAPTITDKSEGVKKITLTDVEPGKIYYVGILPQPFEKGITMTFFNGTSKVGTKTIFNGSAGPTVKRSKVCNVGKVTPEKPEPVFTVDDAGTKVKFAPGNLQATYQSDGTYTWGFAKKQWEYIGSKAGNTTIQNDGKQSTAGNVVDLFGWTATDKGYTDGMKQYGINKSQSNNNYGTGNECCDWGSLIGDGWRVLTSTEWNYLLTQRKLDDGTTACARYAKATVHSVPGLLIIPDGCAVTGSTATVGDVTVTGVNSAGAGFTPIDNNADWESLEGAGCVFLPCAGYRNGSSVSNVGSNGYYWSSSPYTSNASYAYYVDFSTGNVSPQYYSSRYGGFAVRLVCASE